MSIVNFSELEEQKENIKPQQNGHSAIALAKAFSNTPIEIVEKSNPIRLEFEEKLKTQDEVDDPLEIYIEYIKWIKETFPQGNNVNSGLLNVLERCTSTFVKTPHYKDDPRYLRVWVEYIKYCDSPREIFNFLMKNEIGKHLALFYEEFAAWLETNHRMAQADEVYQMGIDVSAHPIARLKRKYSYFSKRYDEMDENPLEHTSPIFNPVRPALALKSSTSTAIPSSDEYSAQPSESVLDPIKESYRVFSDASQPSSTTVKSGSQNGWDSIGSLAQRRKENSIDVKPWVGEKMSMSNNNNNNKNKNQKLMIYRDDSQPSQNTHSANHINQIRKNNTDNLSNQSHKRNPQEIKKRKEKIVADIDMIYPSENQEFCFEELRTKARGLQNLPSISKQMSRTTTCETPTKTINTFQVSLKDSPDSKRPPSPTMTFHTKAATDEIYSMFNQPLKHEFNDSISTSESDSNSDSSSESESDSESDSDAHSVAQSSPNLESEDEEDDEDECSDSDSVLNSVSKYNRNIKTNLNSEPKKVIKKNVPIERRTDPFIFKDGISSKSEKNENLLKKKPTDLNNSNVVQAKANLQSQRYLPKELSSVARKNPIITETLCNPLDPQIRETILEHIKVELQKFENYYLSEKKSNYTDPIKKFIHSKVKRHVGDGMTNTSTSECVLVFNEESYKYKIISQLGEGAFAPVYLAEDISGSNQRKKLCALKIESPPNPWEFYIIRQCEYRLHSSPRILDSIIHANSFHYYKNEAFLSLQYFSQGTVLDLVNQCRVDNGSAIDEIVVMFVAVELLRTIEALHNVNILHGDLKPDNCMIRFSDTEDTSWSSKYYRDGSNGWSTKGIALIDFGRGIDMSIFKPNIQFIAEWETDQQDCPEMRLFKPWTYQVDYYGIASILYVMLFGQYIKTVSEGKSTGKVHHKLNQSFKRYWQQEIWSNLFDVLLNPMLYANSFSKDKPALPITDKLKSCRIQIEDWLEDNCEKNGCSLRQSIKKYALHLNNVTKKL